MEFLIIFFSSLAVVLLLTTVVFSYSKVKEHEKRIKMLSDNYFDFKEKHQKKLHKIEHLFDYSKKEKLLELGRYVRQYGEKQWKKHGNYWKFVLPYSDWYFWHDDYNHQVTLYNEDDELLLYYGMSFGGDNIKATDEEFDTTLKFFQTFDLLNNPLGDLL